MTERVVVILGAGVAGLSAAWWLERAGWQVHVLERSASLREGAYMLGLSGPGYDTARRMDLLPALTPVSFRIEENVYRDRHGRELMRLRYREFLKDLPYLALRRTDLIGTIRAALTERTSIRLGTTATSWTEVDDKVSVRLSDGSGLQADLLIAADGFRSAARRELFGNDPSHLVPLGYRFAVYDLEEGEDIEADFVSYAEPGHMAEYYGLGEGRIAALQVWRDADGPIPAGEARWEMLERVSTTSHPAVRTILGKARSGPLPIIDNLTMVDLPQWSKGRVTLLGDAAHCLTLISGQGAGIAMTSAEILAAELSKAPVEAALARHHARLRPAITKLQQRSRKMAAMFIPASSLGFHFRNLTLRHMPKAWLGRYFVNSIRSEISLTQDAA